MSNIKINTEKYLKLLESFYYHRLINISFLIRDEDLSEREKIYVTNWYEKELKKWQNEKK